MARTQESIRITLLGGPIAPRSQESSERKALFETMASRLQFLRDRQSTTSPQSPSDPQNVQAPKRAEWMPEWEVREGIASIIKKGDVAGLRDLRANGLSNELILEVLDPLHTIHLLHEGFPVLFHTMFSDSGNIEIVKELLSYGLKNEMIHLAIHQSSLVIREEKYQKEALKAFSLLKEAGAKFDASHVQYALFHGKNSALRVVLALADKASLPEFKDYTWEQAVEDLKGYRPAFHDTVWGRNLFPYTSFDRFGNNLAPDDTTLKDRLLRLRGLLVSATLPESPAYFANAQNYLVSVDDYAPDYYYKTSGPLRDILMRIHPKHYSNDLFFWSFQDTTMSTSCPNPAQHIGDTWRPQTTPVGDSLLPRAIASVRITGEKYTEQVSTSGASRTEGLLPRAIASVRQLGENFNLWSVSTPQGRAVRMGAPQGESPHVSLVAGKISLSLKASASPEAIYVAPDSTVTISDMPSNAKLHLPPDPSRIDAHGQCTTVMTETGPEAQLKSQTTSVTLPGKTCADIRSQVGVATDEDFLLSLKDMFSFWGSPAWKHALAVLIGLREELGLASATLARGIIGSKQEGWKEYADLWQSAFLSIPDAREKSNILKIISHLFNKRPDIVLLLSAIISQLPEKERTKHLANCLSYYTKCHGFYNDPSQGEIIKSTATYAARLCLPKDLQLTESLTRHGMPMVRERLTQDSVSEEAFWGFVLVPIQVACPFLDVFGVFSIKQKVQERLKQEGISFSSVWGCLEDLVFNLAVGGSTLAKNGPSLDKKGTRNLTPSMLRQKLQALELVEAPKPTAPEAFSVSSALSETTQPDQGLLTQFGLRQRKNKGQGSEENHRFKKVFSPHQVHD